MGKWLSCICLLLVLLGCSKSNLLSGGQPPKAAIQIGNQQYDTKLGSYCWQSNSHGVCVDTSGPVELLKDHQPIKVNASDEITFVMDYEPKPNTFHVEQINDVGQTEVTLKDNRFSAPSQKGTYYYSYGVWWMDNEVANLSHGSAFYHFVLEVN